MIFLSFKKISTVHFTGSHKFIGQMCWYLCAYLRLILHLLSLISFVALVNNW